MSDFVEVLLVPITIGIITGIVSTVITSYVLAKTTHITHSYEYYPPSLKKYMYKAGMNFNEVLMGLQDERKEDEIKVYYIKLIIYDDSFLQNLEIKKYENFDDLFTTKIKLIFIENQSNYHCTLKSMTDDSSGKKVYFSGTCLQNVPPKTNLYLLVEDIDSMQYLNCGINTYDLYYNINSPDGDVKAYSKSIKSRSLTLKKIKNDYNFVRAKLKRGKKERKR